MYCELYGTVPGWDQPEDSFKIDFLPVTVKMLEKEESKRDGALNEEETITD